MLKAFAFRQTFRQLATSVGVTCIAILGIAPFAGAQTVDWYYDISNVAGLGGTPAPGNWASGAGGAMWSTSAAGTAAPSTTSWASSTDKNAVFDGTAATVPTSGGFGVFVTGLKFKVTGYTISPATSGAGITLQRAHTVDVTTGTATISAVLAGTVGYDKTGAGTLSLTNSGNTITGPVSVTGGTLEISSSAQIGGTGVGSGDITLNGGIFRNATVNSSGATLVTGNRGFVIGANGGTIDVPNSTNIQIYTSGKIDGAGNTLTKSGPGTLRVTTPTSVTFSKLVVTGGLYQAAADNIFGAVPVSTTADAITLNGGGISSNGAFTWDAKRGITIGAANGTINASSSSTVAGVITGVGSLTKTGANILTLSGNNDFQGGVNLNAGRINFNHNNAAGTGTITVANAANIEFASTASGIVLPNAVTLTGGANTAKFYATSGNSLKQTGKISGGGGILRDDTGAGTLTLAGNNDFSGGVKITSRGLVVGNKNGLGTGTFTIGDSATAPANAIVVSAETGLIGANAVPNAVTVNRDFTVGGSSDLEFKGTVDLTASNRTITVSNTANTILSGVVSNGGINKAGAGTLILTGTNTYSGPTNVNAGRLQIDGNNSGATGAVTVNSGGTLGGVGTVGGAVAVKVGGKYGAGDSIGTANFNSTFSYDGGEFDWEFTGGSPVGTGADGDVTNIAGALTINTLALIGAGTNFGTNVAGGMKFVAISYNSTISGAFGNAANLSFVTIGGKQFQINYFDTKSGAYNQSRALYNSAVTLTAVPELSSFLVIGLGGIFAFGVVRLGKRYGLSLKI